jgi:flavin reductase (DIM6/NTAB) family NADH-FMN oxidoreductase RutF
MNVNMNEGKLEAFEWRDVRENPSKMLSEDWMLITAGVIGRWNTMTASWGGFGEIWGMDAAFIFVRPSRHTSGFLEREDGFTLSFFDEGMRDALNICGSKSGRDIDKAKAAGLTPRELRPRRVAFEEARLSIACRKVYAQDLEAASFLDPAIMGNYPKRDIHRLYVGKIEGAWKKA